LCKNFRTAKRAKNAKKTFFNFARLAAFAVRFRFSGLSGLGEAAIQQGKSRFTKILRAHLERGG
jgi:hypothetical protein